MPANINERKLLGVNGLGRMGKLTLWYHLASKKFDGIVANVGREVGRGLEDFIQAITSDSTYGSLNHFLHGHSGRECVIEVIDSQNGLLAIDGFTVKFMNRERNPQNIHWKDEGVRVVVDCTGKFLDPSILANDPRGSISGHLSAGAQKVIVSAPFKSKNPSWTDSEDCPTLIYGINHTSFNPMRHNIISAASCTTTALAHMIKPLLDDQETSQILTASMSTVHAATNTQSVLDSVPAAGTSDLRKNRSVLNNIILSSTGAAKTLEKVIPQTSHFGFMADSIRIPTLTVSLIALNITFSSRLDENGMPFINTEHIKNIYQSAATGAQKDLLYFSTKQNVSQDLLGFPAAVVIEGKEIHTRTGFLQVPQSVLAAIGVSDLQEVNIPVTHAKIMGWYDNEYGSYVNCLGKLTEYVSSQIE
jgi:glyceraldehyde 3-phosphate dehydrogenase